MNATFKIKSTKLLEPFQALREKLFARLYFAQAISLLGDAFTWVGIALLAFELGGSQSARILAIALTLRVTAFILLGSYAGVVADRFNRKKIMILTNLARMVIVVALAFISKVWELYVLIFVLNLFNAFFSPAFKASIAQLVTRQENYANAIALSNATWQLLGLLGPGLAGGLAVWWGSRQIFLCDAFSFILSSLLVAFIPFSRLWEAVAPRLLTFASFWSDLIAGTRLIFKNHSIRLALFAELGAAVAGAQVLVNTVGHVKGALALSDQAYGYTMTAFGIGATLAAFTVNVLDTTPNKRRLLITGALMMSGAVALAGVASYSMLLLLWIVAGLGQSFTSLPSQILIAQHIPLDQQGKAYGSHFAWEHLWWAIGYPLAGFTGIYFAGQSFLLGGLLSLALLLVVWIRFR